MKVSHQKVTIWMRTPSNMSTPVILKKLAFALKCKCRKVVVSCLLIFHCFPFSGNLDGIFPPSAQTDNAPSKRQQSPQSHNKSHYSSSSTIQNNYNYNVVEVLEELSLIDDLASSDEESSSTQEDAASASPKSTAENTDSIPPYVESLNKRQKGHKSQQKKSQKLSQIIFGGLSQPVRALSCHPFITCDLVSNGQRLCPPQQTQYKQMTKRYEYVYAFLLH